MNKTHFYTFTVSEKVSVAFLQDLTSFYVLVKCNNVSKKFCIFCFCAKT